MSVRITDPELRDAMEAGAEALETSATMAGRRGWPVAMKEAEAHARTLRAALEGGGVNELWAPALRALDPPYNEANWCGCGDWKPANDRQCWVCESLGYEPETNR